MSGPSEGLGGVFNTAIKQLQELVRNSSCVLPVGATSRFEDEMQIATAHDHTSSCVCLPSCYYEYRSTYAARDSILRRLSTLGLF